MFLSITEANNYGISLSALRKTNLNEKACFVIKTHHDSPSGVDAFLIDGDGNVGIGTNSPLSHAKLHVNGTLFIGENIGDKENIGGVIDFAVTEHDTLLITQLL